MKLPELKISGPKGSNSYMVIPVDDGWFTKEQAEEIIHRVNSYKKLVKACKRALELISEDLEYAGEPVRENNYKFLEQALKEEKE